MKLNISLKDTQKEFLEQVVKEFSIGECEKSIQSLANVVLNNYDNESVFGEIRCIGGCFSTEESIQVDFSIVPYLYQ